MYKAMNLLKVIRANSKTYTSAKMIPRVKIKVISAHT